jgi:transcriptional regulator with AbiEi antitoxin domain of type IV toxin-antitoxin system
MSGRAEGQVPPSLRRRPFRVLRPQDAGEVYAHPRVEMARLARLGGLRRLANGYYAITPADRIDLPWYPELEAAALGIAVADYGVPAVALMGLSAARRHGAIPRALGVAVVAVPKQRPVLRLADRDASIVFVPRDVDRLELQRTDTELGNGWVTGVQQTLLDLAARPDQGGLPDAAAEAVAALLPRADRSLLTDLATAQRRRPTLHRLLDG